MVAYSFKARFAAPILAGTKAQTIRADRKRHARPGEQLQLFTGMRTKHCRRLGEPGCEEVVPVRMRFNRWESGAEIWIDTTPMAPVLLDTFAQADGFASLLDMRLFWFAEHAPAENEIDFQGWLITWTPLVSVDALDIAARAP